ncbi:GNAT family N-acetyltransferase [Microbacterium thalli]|uniref:GNAT family N-acetyltransferase n=1 Tax=Microbacterium thalli TaxID=3027921 RepID=A0ABT5SEL8_9MICO|nr:GNAT family N-acetyltransferase [Microbacterium thalli]MDD7928665.1 GNAT family N-acetyltransferase [Microbacterium thalli]MDD7961252.1 GNAT family N-acetyltransferase [Microbacterium thalli]
MERDLTWRIESVPYNDERARAMRRELDADLGARYDGFHGDEPEERRRARARALATHAEQIVATLIALAGDTPAGHVIVRRLGDQWEIKRLVVVTAFRGLGIARGLMAAALDAARDDGARRVILQTGLQQPESIALYSSLGFTRIPVYEPYVETMPRSVCFARDL